MRRGSLASLGMTLPRIRIDDPLDRPPAHPAEAHLVPREHDAVQLRTIEAARLVCRPFERTDFGRVRLRSKELRLPGALLGEELVHLALGRVGGTELRAHFLVFAAVRLERVLVPR